MLYLYIYSELFSQPLGPKFLINLVEIYLSKLGLEFMWNQEKFLPRFFA